MDSKYMKIAIEEAKKAFLHNEVPVGAVIVKNNVILSKAYNKKNTTNCSLNHAEILAIKKATEKNSDWRLNECEMYITLEPCPMCAGAILQSRIKKIYIGTKSNIKSNCDVIKNILQNMDYYHQVDIEYLNNKECAEMLSNFFLNKR